MNSCACMALMNSCACMAEKRCVRLNLRDVCEVKALRQLEVELNGGALVWPPQSVHDRDVNLTQKRVNTYIQDASFRVIDCARCDYEPEIRKKIHGPVFRRPSTTSTTRVGCMKLI